MLNCDGWEYATSYHALIANTVAGGGTVAAAVVPVEPGAVLSGYTILSEKGIACSISEWESRRRVHVMACQGLHTALAERGAE